MYKKILAIILCLTLVLSMAACAVAQNKPGNAKKSKQSNTNTPEEVAKQFYLALVQKDVDTMVDLMPQYSYDAIVPLLNIPVEEGLTGRTAAKAAFELAFQNEDNFLGVDYETIEVTTRLTPESDIPGDILQEIRDGYLAYGMMTQEAFDSIEDTAWVDVAHTIVLADGSTEHQDYGEVRLICVKIAGKWYMDFIMVLCMSVALEPSESISDRQE